MFFRRFSCSLALVGGLILNVAAGAAEPPMAPLPPMPSVGDEIVWKKSGVEGDYIVKVIATKKDTFTLKSPSGATTKYSRNFIVSPISWTNAKGELRGEVKVVSGRPNSLFPLDTEKSTSFLDSGYTKDGGHEWQGILQLCYVKSTESLSVPAGTFDVYKVNCRKVKGDWWMNMTWDYAPSVGYYVKKIEEHSNGKLGTWELIRYKKAGN